MMFKNKLTYKLYNTDRATMLIIYNYNTTDTLFYEDISAVILYNILTGREELNKELLHQYRIDNDEYSGFLEECEYLLSSKSNNFNSDNIILKTNENLENNILLNQKLHEAGILFSMHIDVTPSCNFRCIHCYHPFESYVNQEFTFKEIENMFSILNELGVFRITLSGGEPFLRKDIMDIIRLGEKYGFVFEIFTNGSLLNDNIIKQIAALNVSKLSFSYYGDKDAYSYITRSNCYDILMRNVHSCIKYNVNYELKFIAMKCNYKQLPDFFAMAKDFNIRPAAELNITPKLDSDTSNLSEKLDISDYIEIFKNNEAIYAMLSEISPCNANDSIQCNAGKYGLYCDYKGNIYPCVSYRKLLGTYKDLKAIWRGDLLRSVTNKCNVDFSSYKKHSYCDYCYEICPALSVMEGKSEYDCNNSGCEISKAIEKIQLQKGVVNDGRPS